MHRFIFYIVSNSSDMTWGCPRENFSAASSSLIEYRSMQAGQSNLVFRRYCLATDCASCGTGVRTMHSGSTFSSSFQPDALIVDLHRQLQRRADDWRSMRLGSFCYFKIRMQYNHQNFLVGKSCMIGCKP